MTLCANCGSKPITQNSEPRNGGLTRKRYYVCSCGLRFSTLEISDNVVAAIGRARVEREVQRTNRGIEQRALARTRKALVLRALAEGKSAAAAARFAGVSPTRARNIRKEMQSGT